MRLQCTLEAASQELLAENAKRDGLQGRGDKAKGWKGAKAEPGGESQVSFPPSATGTRLSSWGGAKFWRYQPPIQVAADANA